MSEEMIQNVKDRLLASPKKSLRRLSQESGLSRSTRQRAAKKAKLHAYRISVVHELKEPDQVKRVACCRWFQTLLKENPGILDYTWFNPVWTQMVATSSTCYDVVTFLTQ